MIKNNKKLGTEFEREVVRLLSKQGYWVHFVTPDAKGSQPFDIIASKDNIPIVGDCKTSKNKWFAVTRFEENQLTAFEKWFRTGNKYAFVFIKYNEKVYQIPFRMIAGLKKINLELMENFEMNESGELM